MPLSEYQQLETRIMKLEEQNRNLRLSRIILFTLVACLVGNLIMDHIGIHLLSGKRISAEGFILRDSSGNIRAEMNVEGDTAKLAMYDVYGTPRVAMALAGEDPGFHIYDRNGFRRGVFGFHQKGPRFIFMDANGLQRTGWLLMEDGGMGMFSLDERGREQQKSFLKSVRNLIY